MDEPESLPAQIVRHGVPYLLGALGAAFLAVLGVRSTFDRLVETVFGGRGKQEGLVAEIPRIHQQLEEIRLTLARIEGAGEIVCRLGLDVQELNKFKTESSSDRAALHAELTAIRRELDQLRGRHA